MSGKILSLRKRKDIDKVFCDGRSVFNKLFGLKAIRNEEKTNRLAIIVSTKISKKAVIRNKIRRRLREIVKKELISATNNYDLIIISLPAIADKEYRELAEAAQYSLKRLRII